MITSTSGVSVINPNSFLPIQTISYKSYLKEALAGALRMVFNSHPDLNLQTQYDQNGNVIGGTFIGIEYPTDARQYPNILIRVHEQSIAAAGVGHIEYFFNPVTSGIDSYRHTYYHAIAEFEIFALSSLDRDLVSDSLVQILKMPDMAVYTNIFFNEIFDIEIPAPNLNYVNMNIDEIDGMGESISPVPWGSENQLVYQTGYRQKVFGEFYSLPPNNAPVGMIEAVDLYPYIASLGQTIPSGYVASGLYPNTSL
jgi:hypothetical protein